MSESGTGRGQDRTSHTDPTFDGRALVLGFARGISPNKWARRWEETAAKSKVPSAVDASPLELVPLDVNGRPPAGVAPDVKLERTMPGKRPADSSSPAGNGARRAVRLYTESVALVVARDHTLADTLTKDQAVDLASLELVTLLSHPDHAQEWPDPEPWVDPNWAPADAQAALALVASGAGGILLALPLARHLASKRDHAIIPVKADPELPGTEIWATWAVERDAADVQLLIAIMRGRTAQSGRIAGEAPASGSPRQPAAPQTAQSAAHGGGQRSATGSRKKPSDGLPKNSRGAQLAAAREKRKQQRRKR